MACLEHGLQELTRDYGIELLRVRVGHWLSVAQALTKAGDEQSRSLE
jgi:hypothetical protein